MSIETMYLIHIIAEPVAPILLVVFIISLFIMASAIIEKHKNVKGISVFSGIVFIIFCSAAVLGAYTTPFAEAYALQIKGQVVHEGLKSLEYDKILEFIKEVKK